MSPTPDLRAETLQWIDARLAECEAATSEPWSFSGQRGRPGHAFMAQVWRPDGKSLATLDTTPRQTQASNDAAFIASARTALPLALKALRGEAEAHKSTGGKHEFCTRCGEPLQVWPCPALRRVHQSIFGGSNE